MSTKFDRRSNYHELIDDLVDTPTYNSTYSSLPGSLNTIDNQTKTFRERFTTDDRRNQLDAIIKQLSSPIQDELPSPESFNYRTKPTKPTSENLDLVSIDGDATILQRELKEKELDIIHLRKEIQELQMENKLFKSQNPHVTTEMDSFRREKEILQNELRSSHEQIAKLQQQTRAYQIDDIALQQKEIFEKKLRTFEKQMKILLIENDKFKQNSQQTERIIHQLRKDNEDLQAKLVEARKKNDELFYQEFNALRNDIKMLKQRNNELFEENLRLQKPSKFERKQSPNTGETNDLPSDQPNPTISRSKSIDPQFYSRSIRSSRFTDKEDVTNYDDEVDESIPVNRNDTQHQSRRQFDDSRLVRRTTETISPRRPYAPTSINDIHLNDVVKFSRPGGKISKGTVKYIGLLPDKREQYLGLELEDEESKHDGVYQDQRFFQCKPNKGVFVAFNKVIMAWSDK